MGLGKYRKFVHHMQQGMIKIKKAQITINASLSKYICTFKPKKYLTRPVLHEKCTMFTGWKASFFM